MARNTPKKFDPGQFEPLNGKSPEQLATMAAILFGILVLVYVVWSSAYVVKEYEQAVILRFGKYHSTQPNGLRFKMPGMDERVLVDMSEKSMRLPWGHEEQSRDVAISGKIESDEDALILTGDLYAAVVEWHVVWRVVEPEKYIFSFDEEQIKAALVAVARSTMHRIVGDYSADETLTSRREEIAHEALEEMRAEVKAFDAGIEITNLQLQRVTPPDVVKPSFDQVNGAIQKKDQLINEATKERFSLKPMALAESDKLVRDAEGYADRRLAEAEGEISALLAKYKSYQLAPDVTRQRMYLETMEKVMSTGGRKLILDENLKSMLPLLQVGSKAP